MPKWLKWMLGVFVGMAMLGALFGEDPERDEKRLAGSQEVAQTDSEPSEEPTAEPTPEPEPEPVTLSVSGPRSRTVRKPEWTVSGRSERGAQVKVGGERVKVDSRGRFSRTVELGLGANTIGVSASKRGMEKSSKTMRVTRRRSAEEIAELRAQREQERLEAMANFKAAATAIPYNQLEKAPERYKGSKVAYRGQIFQIQEDYGSTWMLLSVTDEGYGFWDDNVWVDFDGTIKGAEDDIVTVYGTVKGSESYETQIGGETYVPKIKARYIEE